MIDAYCLISSVYSPNGIIPYLGYCWYNKIIFNSISKYTNPKNPTPICLVILFRIAMVTYNIAAPIDIISPIGYTPENLFNALSDCSACTHRELLVDFPMKSSPRSRNNPNGISAPVVAKNNTSLYTFLFSNLFISLKNNRIAILNPRSIPMK